MNWNNNHVLKVKMKNVLRDVMIFLSLISLGTFDMDFEVKLMEAGLEISERHSEIFDNQSPCQMFQNLSNTRKSSHLSKYFSFLLSGHDRYSNPSSKFYCYSNNLPVFPPITFSTLYFRCNKYDSSCAQSVPSCVRQ